MSSADGYQLNFAHDDFASLDRFDSLVAAARRDEVVRDLFGPHPPLLLNEAEVEALNRAIKGAGSPVWPETTGLSFPGHTLTGPVLDWNGRLRLVMRAKVLGMFAGSLLVTAPEWDIPHVFMTINVVRGSDGWEPRFADEPLGCVVRAVERSGAKNRVTVRHFPGGDVRWATSGEASLEAAMRNEPGWIHAGEIVG